MKMTRTSWGPNVMIDGSIKEAQKVMPTTLPGFTVAIPLQWEPLRYIYYVGQALDSLYRSKVGSAVLAQLNRQVTIRPWLWAPTNAVAIPDQRVDATKFGSSIDGVSDIVGTGRGTAATIWFTPANRQIPDASLLHEMVHAM